MTSGRVRLDFQTQKSFLEHLFKESLIRLGSRREYDERKERLARLKSEVEAGNYAPQPTVALLSDPKGAGVPRFVPVFSLRDYAVYFGCVRAVDRQLAQQAIPGTFGGWSLGGGRRAKESLDAAQLIREATDGFYAPPAAYNPAAWVKNWNQFWKLLWLTFNESDEGAYFVSFDIANFYDSIDLPRLERQVRNVSPGEDFSIEVLFFLLGHWNNRHTSYSRSSKGLPQDLIGDCSRVLANGYLVPVDEAISERCAEVGARYLRYADDMTIAARDRETCAQLLFGAAQALNRLGLNINVSKVTYLNKKEFELHWGFEVMASLDRLATLDKGVALLRERWTSDGFARKGTALRRATSGLMRRPDLTEERRWVYRQVTADASGLLSLGDRQMTALVEIAPRPKDGLTALRDAVLSDPHSAPRLKLLRCVERLRDRRGVKGFVRDIIGELSGSSDDPAIRLAVRRGREWSR